MRGGERTVPARLGSSGTRNCSREGHGETRFRGLWPLRDIKILIGFPTFPLAASRAALGLSGAFLAFLPSHLGKRFRGPSGQGRRQLSTPWSTPSWLRTRGPCRLRDPGDHQRSCWPVKSARQAGRVSRTSSDQGILASWRPLVRAAARTSVTSRRPPLQKAKSPPPSSHRADIAQGVDSSNKRTGPGDQGIMSLRLRRDAGTETATCSTPTLLSKLPRGARRREGPGPDQEPGDPSV